MIEVTVRFSASDGIDTTYKEATFKIYRTDYLYFSKGATGDGLSPANPKGATGPDINSAINEAKISGLKAVAISEGTYEVTYAETDGTHVQMKDGVSLYGGYSSSTFLRNRAQYITTIKDMSHDIGEAVNNPSRTVELLSGTSPLNIIDGFTLIAGTDDSTGAASVIFCKKDTTDISISISNNIITTQDNNFADLNGIIIFDVAATIKYNEIVLKSLINNGSGNNSNNRAIYIRGEGNCSISNNEVSLGSAISTTDGHYARSVGFFLTHYTGDITIFNNTIEGGYAHSSPDPSYTGIYDIFMHNSNFANISIYNNTLICIQDGSIGYTANIYIVYSNPTIINNLLYISGTDTSEAYNISEGGMDSDPFIVQNNGFYNDINGYFYYDYSTHVPIYGLFQSIYNEPDGSGTLSNWGNRTIDSSDL